MKVYDVANAFGISQRLVFRNVAEMNVCLKKEPKAHDDYISIVSIFEKL